MHLLLEALMLMALRHNCCVSVKELVVVKIKLSSTANLLYSIVLLMFLFGLMPF